MEYVTIAEAARQLGTISEKTIRRAIAAGKLKARYPHSNRAEVSSEGLETLASLTHSPARGNPEQNSSTGGQGDRAGKSSAYPPSADGSYITNQESAIQARGHSARRIHLPFRVLSCACCSLSGSRRPLYERSTGKRSKFEDVCSPSLEHEDNTTSMCNYTPDMTSEHAMTAHMRLESMDNLSRQRQKCHALFLSQ